VAIAIVAAVAGVMVWIGLRRLPMIGES
jgi:hypothetical protein